MTTNSIYTQYFTYTNDNYVKYGDKTVVLLQVGAFFEVYGVKSNTTSNIIHSNIVEFAEICQLNISEKSQLYGEGQIVMAGFRDFTIDKYLLKLTDAGYSVPVYIQEKNGNDISRKLDKVYSSGTYLSCDTDSSPNISNNIMCIWLEIYKPYNKSNNNKNNIVYGVSVVDIFTGKSSIFQYETTFYMNTTTFDELERYVSIFNPNELIIISPFDNNDLNNIFQFIGIQTNNIHKIDIRENNTKITNCTNQKYIKSIIETYFDETTYDVCSEFTNRIMATQSFCYLLNFIQEHNPNLVRKISLPNFNNTSDRMILANHTLLQLNIISDMTRDSMNSGKLSSVLSFLNKCCSPMGKRKFQYQLTNPTFNIQWLNMEYNMIDKMLSNYDFIPMFRKQLGGMRDLDKICRQLISKTIYPSTIFHLYNSIQSALQINVCFAENQDICNYLCNEFTENITDGHSQMDKTCNDLISFLDTHFIISTCKLTSSMTTFTENIIQTGVSLELDHAIIQYNFYKQRFHTIHTQLNTLIQENEKTPDIEYVKIHETEKSGLSLQITAKRSKLIEKVFENYGNKPKVVLNLD
jgi:DNA mismatch repair protein MutS